MRFQPNDRETTKGLCICHAGSVLSFKMILSHSGKAITVVHEDGRKKLITHNGPAISMCCPSVEGTAIFCWLENQEFIVLDTLSGRCLTQQETARMRISFYA